MVWYLENVGERFERLQRRFRRWRTGSEWGYNEIMENRLPIAADKLTAPAPKKNSDNCDLKPFLEPAAFEKPAPVETLEPEQNDQQNERHDAIEESCSFKDSPENESQACEVTALKHELAQQADELTTLKKILDEENRANLQDAETRYQKLADDLAASQLAHSQMQTDLANANQSSGVFDRKEHSG